MPLSLIILIATWAYSSLLQALALSGALKFTVVPERAAGREDKRQLRSKESWSPVANSEGVGMVFFWWVMCQVKEENSQDKGGKDAKHIDIQKSIVPLHSC